MYRLITVIFLSILLFSCNRQLTTETTEVVEEIKEVENRQETEKEDKVSKTPINTKVKEIPINTIVEAPEIPVSPFVGLELDIFGNKYIYSDIEIIKLSPVNDTIAVFSTRRTAGISSISVTNPNKLIVYSRDSQSTWTLDSTLSVIEDKRVDQPDLGEIGFITRLEGDDILSYSKSTKKFYRSNNSNNKIIESDVQWNMESEILDIVESQDRFIVRNENNRVFLFDSFGNLIKEVKVEINDGPVDFQNNFIFQIENNQLRYLDLTDPTAEFKEYKLSKGLRNVSDFKLARQKVFSLSNGKVTEQKVMIVNY